MSHSFAPMPGCFADGAALEAHRAATRPLPVDLGSALPVLPVAVQRRIEASFTVHIAPLSISMARREQFPFLRGACAAMGCAMPKRWKDAVHSMTLVTSLPPL